MSLWCLIIMLHLTIQWRFALIFKLLRGWLMRRYCRMINLVRRRIEHIRLSGLSAIICVATCVV